MIKEQGKIMSVIFVPCFRLHHHLEIDIKQDKKWQVFTAFLKI